MTRAGGTSLSIASALAALVTSAAAHAQAPAINLGQALDIRFENSSTYQGETRVGMTKLVLNTLLDTDTEGPFVVTLEQGGHVLAHAACRAEPEVYSGEVQPGQGFLRECATENIPASTIRTNAPVDIAVALVDDATDRRTEIYRGSFPVYAYYWWEGNQNNQPVHVEQRALRLDSFYSVIFARQYLSDTIEFTYVDAQQTGDRPDDGQMRCRVGAGEWRAYETSVYDGEQQSARNRVWIDGTVHEDGPETVVTKFIHFSARMPIAIAGRRQTASAGSSMDGDWTCELRYGGAGNRWVAREFRFAVQGGFVRPNAIETQVAPGRGAVLLSAGLNPEHMPSIFDPALVRDAVAGRHLTGATAPLLSPMPARATNPAFTALRGGAAAGGARGGRGGSRSRH